MGFLRKVAESTIPAPLTLINLIAESWSAPDRILKGSVNWVAQTRSLLKDFPKRGPLSHSFPLTYPGTNWHLPPSSFLPCPMLEYLC